MSSGSWMKCPVIIPYFGGKFELSQYLVPMLHKHNRYIGNDVDSRGNILTGSVMIDKMTVAGKWLNIINTIN